MDLQQQVNSGKYFLMAGFMIYLLKSTKRQAPGAKPQRPRARMKSMKVIFMLLVVLGLLILSCRNEKVFHEAVVNNPEFIPDSAFVSFENLSSPKFRTLREKYQLDTVFHGERGDFKRILRLRDWISRVIKIDDYGPYAGDGSVESILDEALKGKGFHCGHYTAVQNAVANAYGYVTRCLLADTGVPVDYMVGGGHHAINETWINSYHKWFLSDAKYNYHFEKNGIPLSALEIRDEYLKNKAADIVLVKGIDRIPTAVYPGLNISKEEFARVYTWLSWGIHNNRYSNWPKTNTDLMIMYEDDYFKNHTWLWDGKPHWAYHTKFMHLVTNRKVIEWTPNSITASVRIEANLAHIELRSITPNLRTYQMKELPDGDWKDVSNAVEVELKKDENQIVFRTVNLADVSGPEHRVVIEAGKD